MISSEFKEILESLNLSIKPKYNEVLKKYTSFRIGGCADVFIEPTNFDELKKVVELVKTNNIPYTVIGNGSNLLISDNGFCGVVIRLSKSISKIDLIVENNEDYILAETGALFSVIGKVALENGLDGFAELSGIPSTVGGGIVMNAGAYGVEIKDVLVECVVLTRDLEIVTVSVDSLDLGYRCSNIMENEYIILMGKFKLSKGDTYSIRNKMAEISKKRRESQPLEYPSAGSTFKRPDGHFAGKLVEDCGLKGVRVGGAMVSEKHAGFLINYDSATCEDMLKLIELCKKNVLEKFGVELEMEVKVI